MEAILDGYVTDEEKLYQYYEMILTETSRLEATIQEILELSSLFEKKIQKEAVSAEQVFKEILFRYSTIGEDQGIVFLFPDITQLPSLKTNQKIDVARTGSASSQYIQIHTGRRIHYS